MVTDLQATVAFLPMSGSFRTTSLLMLTLLLTQAGCVALNIPSHRAHDPEDRGGLLGHWKDAKHRQPDWVNKFPGMDPAAVERAAAEATMMQTPRMEAPLTESPHDLSQFHGGGCFCSDCEAGQYDPMASTQASAEESEIPWPKFHPVPTRPIYGRR